MGAQVGKLTPDKPNPLEFYGGYQVYSDSGVDLTLLRENLRRSIEVRLANKRRAAELANAFRAAGPLYPGLPEVSPPLDDEALFRCIARVPGNFVVVGAVAMVIHGSAYITFDLDLCCEWSDENLQAIRIALSPYVPMIRDEASPQRSPELRLRTAAGDVDLLREIPGVGGYEQVLGHSEEHTIYDEQIRVLSLDALIAAKKAADRRKDWLHLLELDELKKLRDAAP